MTTRVARNDRYRVPATDLIDLVSEELGGKALLCNDEFFAGKENLVKAAPAVFIPDKYTEFGKWMDGWESRRKRELPVHDWCIMKLGSPGTDHGRQRRYVALSGKFPEYCSSRPARPPRAHPERRRPRPPGRKSCPRPTCTAAHAIFCRSRSGERFTHLRLRIFPDGGVARACASTAIVLPDWAALKREGQPIDLAAAENGGTVVTCNDMFFGHKDNLLPARPRAAHGRRLGDPPQTRPRPRLDHRKLAASGRVRKIEVDTNHFKGNFPDSCSIDGCVTAGATLLPADFRDRTDIQWTRDPATHETAGAPSAFL